MSTRERLLDAAEELFARQGVASASLREITSTAEANLAAVNYHFGNKDGLLRAVVQRRAEPLTEERTRLLVLAEKAAGTSPPTVEAVLHAFVEPVFRMAQNHPHFTNVMGRVLMENLMPIVGPVFRATIHRTMIEFSDALTRALPELPGAEIRWRLIFTVGVFHFIACGHLPIRVMMGSKGQDADSMTARVVAFCEAGLRAPLPEGIVPSEPPSLETLEAGPTLFSGLPSEKGDA